METAALALGSVAIAAGAALYLGYRLGHRDGWRAAVDFWRRVG